MLWSALQPRARSWHSRAASSLFGALPTHMGPSDEGVASLVDALLSVGPTSKLAHLDLHKSGIGAAGAPLYHRWRSEGKGGDRGAIVVAPQPIDAAAQRKQRFSPREHRAHDRAFARAQCFLNCSYPRGKCLQSGCVCGAHTGSTERLRLPRTRRGFYGQGCVFPYGDGGEEAAGRPGLRVYVYDWPSMLTARRSWAKAGGRP